MLNVMKEGEIRSVLRNAGIVPSRKMGQNFLCNEEAAQKIVDLLEITPTDTVIEVGSGTGALSELIAGRVKRLILIEYDRRLADYLRQRFSSLESVEVLGEDGARFDVRPLFAFGKVKMIGNLPYSAGGAILRNFLKAPSPISRAVLMLQHEFVNRILARPKTKDYGVLTLRMQSVWDSKAELTVPPEDFFPQPKIDSTVMVVTHRENQNPELPVYDARLFDELLRRGFAQRRKQLKKSLPKGKDWGQIASEIHVTQHARAEELSLENWVALTCAYDNHPLAKIAQDGNECFDVVDENDQVTGNATRDEVHQRGLMHRAVHVFVVNDKEEIFLQKRSRLKDRCAGLWDSSAAGHLDQGEDYREAAVRELAEELSISAGVDSGCEIKKLGKLPPNEATGWEHIWLGFLQYSGVPRFPCSEIEAGLWIGVELVDDWVDARSEDFAPGFLDCWTLWRALRRKDVQS